MATGFSQRSAQFLAIGKVAKANGTSGPAAGRVSSRIKSGAKKCGKNNGIYGKRKLPNWLVNVGLKVYRISVVIVVIIPSVFTVEVPRSTPLKTMGNHICETI
jgi:hypothetical protein